MNRIQLPGVIFEFTTKCNLKCRYCYNYWKKETDYIEDIEKCNPKKTLKQWFKRVKTDRVTFSGGEPTTNFDELLDCIMYLKRRNKKVTIITNATLLSKEKLELLAMIKVDLFEITINSYDKNIHEMLNGVKDSFEKSVTAIKYLLSRKCDVVVPVVITKYNVLEIDKTLDYIYNLGIKRIMVNRYNIGGNGCNDVTEILPTLEELKTAYKKCNDFAIEKDIKLHSLVCCPICAINPDDYSNIVFSNCACKNKNRKYTLTRDGNVRYCNHSPSILGNIYNETMKNIISSEKLNQWAQIEPEFCTDCSKKELCHYGCRAASEQMGYGLSKEDPIIDMYGIKHGFPTE